MRSYDLLLSFFIIIVFMSFYSYNIASLGIDNIANNWPLYRCNPSVMPFAFIFGEDTKKNFVHCIQNMQTSYMGYLLQPLNYNFNVISALGTTIAGSVNKARGFFNSLRSMMSLIIENVFGVFLNIIIEFQRVTINIKDLFGKVVGILATLMYTISGSIMTMQSMWKGPPGQLVKKLCFKPSTLIETEEGFKPMKDVLLGDKLKNGTTVRGVLKISNIDDLGNHIEKLYRVNGGEKSDPIFVSGSHLIYDPEVKRFIEVKYLTQSELQVESCDEFSCLITDNHTIPIGDWLFHDWEDTI